MNRTTGVLRQCDRAATAIGVLALLAMMALSVANALWRYLLNAPISNSMEIVTYWFMPAAMLAGFFLATARDDVVEVTLISDTLAPAARRLNASACAAVTAVIAGAFTWFTFHEAVESWQVGRTGGVTGLLIWPITFMVPLAFLGICIISVISIVETRRSTPVPESEGQH